MPIVRQCKTYADEHGALGLARRRATSANGHLSKLEGPGRAIGRLDVDDIAREEGNAPAQMRR